MLGRLEQEQWEEKHLASYAMKVSQSLGRAYPEPLDPFRTAFQRDRDRVVHCSAFRRLEYKTQVFISQMKEQHCRSRLTHTLEVSQVARTIARVLRLNEDLVEAIALAHDLGHPPFGHTGQHILNQLMQSFGGFEHNKQARRIVDLLEHRYPHFPGLNLTQEVRDSLLKHTLPPPQPLLEAQVSDLSDSIAYDCHDTEDSLEMGMIHETELLEVPLWRESYEAVAQTLEPKQYPTLFHKFVLKHLLSRLVQDVIATSVQKIQNSSARTPAEFQKLPYRCVTHSEEIAKKKHELHRFLSEKVFHHYKMHQISTKTERCLKTLFETFQKNPEQLPPYVKPWIQRDGVERAVCDYLACYTDREIFADYKRLFLPE